MGLMGKGLPRKRTYVRERTYVRGKLPHVRRSSMLIAGTLGLVAGVATPGAALSSAYRAPTATTATPGAALSSAHRAPTATTSRQVSLNLNMNTHLVGRAGRTFREQGRVSGTISGTVGGRFHDIEGTRGTGEFTIYDSRGGTLICRTMTHGSVSGAFVHSEGALSIVGGTGRWAHAHSTSIHYKGAVDRRSLRASGQMQGSVSL
jgi:hypothetical protein